MAYWRPHPVCYPDSRFGDCFLLAFFAGFRAICLTGKEQVIILTARSNEEFCDTISNKYCAGRLSVVTGMQVIVYDICGSGKEW